MQIGSRFFLCVPPHACQMECRCLDVAFWGLPEPSETGMSWPCPLVGFTVPPFPIPSVSSYVLYVPLKKKKKKDLFHSGLGSHYAPNLGASLPLPLSFAIPPAPLQPVELILGVPSSVLPS